MAGGQHRQDRVRIHEGGPVRAKHKVTGRQQQGHHREADGAACLNGVDHEALQLRSPAPGVQVGDERQHHEDDRLRAEHRQPRQLARGTVQPGVAGAEHRPDDQDVRLLRQNELRSRNHDEAANGPHPLVGFELGRGRHGSRGSGVGEQEEAHTQRDRRRRSIQGHRLSSRELHAEPRTHESDADAEQHRPEEQLRELRLRDAPEPLERAAGKEQERADRDQSTCRPNPPFDAGVEVSPEQPRHHTPEQRHSSRGAADHTQPVEPEAAEQPVLPLPLVRGDETDGSGVELELPDQDGHVDPRQEVAVDAIARWLESPGEDDLHHERCDGTARCAADRPTGALDHRRCQTDPRPQRVQTGKQPHQRSGRRSLGAAALHRTHVAHRPGTRVSVTKKQR